MRRKCSVNNKAPLVNITTSYPLKLVSIDFLTLEIWKGGFGNILVIIDHFTKYAVALPTRNQTARTTADAFYNNFFINFEFTQIKEQILKVILLSSFVKL